MPAWLGPAAASVLGGLFSSSGASKASAAQLEAAQIAADLQEKMFNQARDDSFMGTERGDDILTQSQSGAVAALRNGRDKSINVLNRTHGQSVDAINNGFGVGRNVLNETYRRQEGMYDPMIQRGDQAAGIFDFLMGMGDRPANYQFRTTPAYEFQRSQGLSAIDQSAAGAGNLHSGETMKSAMQYATGLADQFQGDYMDRLSGTIAQGNAGRDALGNALGQRGAGLAGLATGKAGALAGLHSSHGAGLAGIHSGFGGDVANIRTATGTNRANLWGGLGRNLSALSMDAGAAQAQGALGVGDAIAAGAVGQANAVNGAIQNGLNTYMMNQYMDKFASNQAVQ